MKTTVKFDVAPSAAEWAAVLAEDGWKITHLNVSKISAEKIIGNDATYPPRKRIRWFFIVEECDDDGVTITIEVPVFANSVFSKQRLLDTISDYTEKVDGGCSTKSQLKLQLIDKLYD